MLRESNVQYKILLKEKDFKVFSREKRDELFQEANDIETNIEVDSPSDSPSINNDKNS